MALLEPYHRTVAQRLRTPELSPGLLWYIGPETRQAGCGRAKIGGMARRKTAAAARPSPPADAKAGAALVRQFVVGLFDRRDGNGVNWKLVAETLFKAAFDVLDKLPEDDRRAMARRVHAGAYDRVAGNRAGEEAEKPKPPVEAANAVVFAKASRPHPPR